MHDLLPRKYRSLISPGPGLVSFPSFFSGVPKPRLGLFNLQTFFGLLHCQACFKFRRRHFYYRRNFGNDLKYCTVIYIELHDLLPQKYRSLSPGPGLVSFPSFFSGVPKPRLGLFNLQTFFGLLHCQACFKFRRRHFYYRRNFGNDLKYCTVIYILSFAPLSSSRSVEEALLPQKCCLLWTQ